MKNLQKFVLPLLIFIIVAVLYVLYFAPTDELGSFSRLDPNSNASVPIAVKLVKEKGVKRAQDGTNYFYVIDKDNKEVMITGIKILPPGMNDAKALVITGHLSGESFHAHGIELRN